MDHFPENFSRRRALRGIGALAVGTSVGLSGCCLFKPRPLDCVNSPDINLPTGPLTIDAHCHIFNGTDIPVMDFVGKVMVGEASPLGPAAMAVGALLQGLAWSLAPSGDMELETLRELSPKLATCTSEQAKMEVISRLRRDAYAAGTASLKAAAATSPLYLPFIREKQSKLLIPDMQTRLQVEALEIIDKLPATIPDLDKDSPEPLDMLSGDRSVMGVIKFILQNFQYRYVNIQQYLRTFNVPGVRMVDLLMPSMVDYSWWISKGKPTATSLETQVQVMEQLSILTGGRMHGFVPFCPLREVAFSKGKSATSSFDLVQRALEEHGFIGVKLYPPMGFAALGNQYIQDAEPDFWRRRWLPEWVQNTPDLGKLLDDALRRLYDYCQKHGVPIMAHTGLSNGPSMAFKNLAGSKYWACVLKEFPRLRVNFGHFGDTSIVKDQRAGFSLAEAFAKEMNASGPGEFAYADAGFFTEVISDQPELKADLQKLYNLTAPKGSASLANRFLYGTDWEMSLTASSIGSYLSDFMKLFKELEELPSLSGETVTTLSNKFFGDNAVRYAGLSRGGETRLRLQAFYDKHGVKPPAWRLKVDGRFS
ncbi:amidohydrolase family protein [Janthinobacterium sp. GMG1]|uniref:amidohydrolase family protein n=1 Tax=Janthinobacterium sp. GMG1 TaxID=3096007 RepID=UPI002ACA2E0C|nr:amidohydrolase family protein [Janthinobacterium sp. GMG1]MDZ5636293.1 amidohydrolase family protein [Janthinobacterium sp. GMG1]